MVKKILFPLISIFLFYRSIELIRSIEAMSPEKVSILGVVLLSLLLNLFITGVFAFVGFAYRTSALLSDEYYRIKNPARIKALGKRLGLDYFRKFLLLVFWGKKKNRKKYFDGTRAGLDNLDYQAKQSEFGHLMAAIAVQLAACYLIVKGHYAIGVVSTVLNFISNYYPILLQRTHRIQLERMIHIKNSRRRA